MVRLVDNFHLIGIILIRNQSRRRFVMFNVVQKVARVVLRCFVYVSVYFWITFLPMYGLYVFVVSYPMTHGDDVGTAMIGSFTFLVSTLICMNSNINLSEIKTHRLRMRWYLSGGAFVLVTFITISFLWFGEHLFNMSLIGLAVIELIILAVYPISSKKRAALMKFGRLPRYD